MHALGYYRAGMDELMRDRTSAFFDDEIAAAVDAFRADQGISHSGSGGTPPGFVDAQAVRMMWAELEAEGKAEEMRELIRSLVQVRR